MARKQLAKGETTIDSAQPTFHTKTQDGKEVSYIGLWWSGRLQDGTTIRRRTTAKIQPGKKSNATLTGPLRRRARATWKKILDEEAGRSWTGQDRKMADFIEMQATRMDEKTLDPEFERLRPDSRSRYRLTLRKLAEIFDSQTIQVATQPENLKAAILTVRNENLDQDPRPRIESARQAKNTLSNYVLDELVIRKVIPRNELRSMRINLAEGTRKPQQGYDPQAQATGPRALTEAQWEAVRDYLLARDVSKDPVSKQGRWSPEHRRATTQAAIDLTLLQMATGLRFYEAIQIEWGMVIDDGSQMMIHVPDYITKTKTSRTVAVLDSQIAAHMRQRGARLSGKFVIGSPHDPNVQWDRSNARAKTRHLYNNELSKIAPLLGQPGVGGHVWRATLNEIYLATVPEADRIKQFGHTAAVNRRHYTTSNPARIMDAAKQKGRL